MPRYRKGERVPELTPEMIREALLRGAKDARETAKLLRRSRQLSIASLHLVLR